jgi:hypothetical protein
MNLRKQVHELEKKIMNLNYVHEFGKFQEFEQSLRIFECS